MVVVVVIHVQQQQPFYRSTSVSWNTQLRTGGFSWSSFTAHMPLLAATGIFGLQKAVLFNATTYTISITTTTTTNA